MYNYSHLQAISLDPRSKKIKLCDGNTLSYDKCLLATGGDPRNLDIFSKGDKELQKRTSTFRKVQVTVQTVTCTCTCVHVYMCIIIQCS